MCRLTGNCKSDLKSIRFFKQKGEAGADLTVRVRLQLKKLESGRLRLLKLSVFAYRSRNSQWCGDGCSHSMYHSDKGKRILFWSYRLQVGSCEQTAPPAKYFADFSLLGGFRDFFTEPTMPSFPRHLSWIFPHSCEINSRVEKSRKIMQIRPGSDSSHW